MKLDAVMGKEVRAASPCLLERSSHLPLRLSGERECFHSYLIEPIEPNDLTLLRETVYGRISHNDRSCSKEQENVGVLVCALEAAGIAEDHAAVLVNA